MKFVYAGLIPKDLNLLLKRHWIGVTKEMLNSVAEGSIFIKPIITADETWVYEYNGETVQKSSDYKIGPIRSKIKMMIVLFDYCCAVRHEFVLHGQTDVNVKKFIVKDRICGQTRVIAQPAYFLYLAPCDFSVIRFGERPTRRRLTLRPDQTQHCF